MNESVCSSRGPRNLCLAMLLALALLTLVSMSIAVSATARADPLVAFSTVALPEPLPRGCPGVNPPGGPVPACCMFGYIYYGGMPIGGVDVRIESLHGSIVVTTTGGDASSRPYYAADLSSAPLDVSPGDVVTITASYSNMVSSRAWTVQNGGQHVDLGLVDGYQEVTAMSGPLLAAPGPAASRAARSAAAGEDVHWSDGFEGATLDATWVVTEQYGTITVTTEQSYSGSQAVKLSSTSGGQREIHLIRQFSTPVAGTASVWFYDTAPGSQTLYAGIQLYLEGQFVAAVTIRDHDGSFYHVYGGGLGDATYPRSLGWDLLEIDTAAGEIHIDGSEVLTFSGDLSFDTVDLFVSGPDWRPNATYYFDDVRVDSVPGVQFSSSASSVDENEGSVTLTVTLSATSTKTISVSYDTSDGTAVAGSDYVTTSGVLAFAPGSTVRTLAVPLMNDELNEPDEVFMVTLSNPANATLGAFDALTVTVVNEDYQWIELAPEGSPPHPIWYAKPIQYDAAHNRLIAFFPGNPPYNPDPPGNGNEVWVLTNANGLGGTPVWTKLEPTGTPPASNWGESAVYDAATNRLIVYGGCVANCGSTRSDVFVLTNANGLGGSPVWSQITVTNPQDRVDHRAIYDSANDLMITFGGQHGYYGSNENDTRVLSNANGTTSPSTWTTLSPAGGPPSIRSGHTAIYDQAGNRMTIFGGVELISALPYNHHEYNDTWVLADANGLGTPAWMPLTPTGDLPLPRQAHSAVYDTANNRMIVYGGDNFSETTQAHIYLGDLWELSNANGLGGTSAWNELSSSGASPGPRAYHTAAMDVANQRMIVFGGFDQVTTTNRVWVLILPQPTPAPSAPTPPGNVIVSGPAAGIVGASYTFTATVAPVTATLPISYVWQATGQTPVTHTGGGLDDVIGFTWSTAGTQYITVTASNSGGAFTATLSITIADNIVPPAGVVIDGPAVGLVSTPYTFTATVTPVTATLPITYVWQATGQTPVTHTGGGLDDVIGFTWSTAGTQYITVTASNSGGTLTTTTVITIAEYAAPSSAFVAAPLSGTVPLDVQFTDQSTGAIISWDWAFGDGGVSGARHPAYEYAVTGTYTVSLSVTGPGGSDTETKTDYIDVLPPTTWTFILYFAGDNNLHSHLEHTVDRLERVASQPNVSILVLWDGLQSGDTRLYHVEYDTSFGIASPVIAVGWNSGELNTGNAQTLVDFVNWARANYPADHYFLSIANHGRGTTGIAWDDTSSGDNLSAYAELGSALDSITGSGSDKIDVLFLDACLMAMIEDAYEVKDDVDYLVASENLGWSVFAYDVYVASVGDDTTPQELAVSVADAYFAALLDYPGTVSVLDMSAVEGLGSAVDAFAQTLDTYVSASGASKVRDIRQDQNGVQPFDSRNYQVLDRLDDEYIDLYHFAELVEADIADAAVQSAAQDVMDAISSCVVAEHHQSGYDPWSNNYWNLDNAHGIAIYFPPQEGGWDYSNYVAGGSWAFCNGTAWDEFLVSYFSVSGLPPETPTNPGTPPMQGVERVFLPFAVGGE